MTFIILVLVLFISKNIQISKIFKNIILVVFKNFTGLFKYYKITTQWSIQDFLER